MEKKKSNAQEEPKLKRVMKQLDEFFKTRYALRYNDLTEYTEIKPLGKKSHFIPIDRREINRLITEAIYSDIDCLDRDVYRYLESSNITSTNPMKEYIAHLPEWDHIDRVKQLTTRISEEPIWRSLFPRWLRGMIAHWIGRNPLHGNALMPILVRERQGLKKSTSCRLLLPEELQPYYTDEFDISSKSDYVKKIAKFGLINIDEFRRMSEMKSERLKNLLQMADVNIHRKGGGGYERKLRLASFIGTSNYKELLSDPTGTRRYLPVVQQGKLYAQRINYEQLYAQLHEELQANKLYWLNAAEERKLTERNVEFARRPIEEPLFFKYFSLPAETDSEAIRLSATQIYDALRKKSPATMRDIKMAQFGEHLAMLGAKKVRTSCGYCYRVKKTTLVTD